MLSYLILETSNILFGIYCTVLRLQSTDDIGYCTSFGIAKHTNVGFVSHTLSLSSPLIFDISMEPYDTLQIT
jgi:hypothetical protein